MKPFADHFSQIAVDYATYRPRYPEALFTWLASIAPTRHHAWDCATGNGQAAVALSRHFAYVVATDPSTAQIASAEAAERVGYAAMTAEHSALATGVVELVTVAQALHWLDRDVFFVEARRVLVQRGVLAVWSYGLCALGDPELDRLLHHFYRETVGPYWPAERAIVDRGYEQLAFPFDEISAPEFAMEVEWTLDQFAGYVGTWSAVQHARGATGADPVPDFIDGLRRTWGEERATRAIAWPLSMRVGRV